MPPDLQQASILNQEENDRDVSNHRIEMSDMGDAENADIQLQPIGTDGLEATESDRVTIWNFIFPLTGIIFHLWDVGSDIKLACNYLSEEKILFGVLTIVFVFAPAIINVIISFRMDKRDEQSDNDNKFITPIWKRKAWIKVPIFLLSLAPLFYNFSSIRYAYKSRKYEKKKDKIHQRDYYKKMIVTDEEFAMLKIFDAFLEAAPQLTLQLTIFLSNPDKTALPSWNQIGSLCSSFFSMALTMTSYQRTNRLAQDDKANISIPGSICQFLWHICVTTSRIIAISILASQWPIFTICACFVHWFSMTLWLIVEPLGIPGFCGNFDRGAGEPLNRKAKIRCWLFAAVLGFVYIFIHLNPGENPTFWRHLFYFVLCGIENLLAVILWAVISDQSVKSCWYFDVLIILTTVTFILGTLFMIIYYKRFHPNVDQKYSSSQGIGTSANCTSEALGCLSAFVLCHFF